MKLPRPFILTFTILFACATAFANARVARAETPVLETNFPGGDFGEFDNPQYISEPWFMWFVLGELQSPDDVDMVTFDYKAGDRFKAEMFIPAHDELRDFSPTIALVGPGLPQPTEPLPFALPEGMGAVVANSDSTFHYFDIFTQMSFFPRAKIDMPLPQTGRYFVATYGQPIGSARYALDIGVMETFAPNVLARYPINWWEVRDFLQWGHWPALLVAPALALVAAWLIRKRGLSKRSEQIVGALGLGGFALTLILINAQQVAGHGAQITTALALIGVIALAVLGSVIWGAYLLTPLREKLNLREFAGDDHFAWVNGYAIHYSDHGPHDAPAAVLIHGFAASEFTWRLLTPALLRAGYRVITTDQIGYGASARPAEPVYTTEMQARFVLGVLDTLGVQQAHFVGHSFGGRVAMQIALLAPERALSLAALAPEAFATERPGIAKLVRAPILGYVLAFYSTSPALVRDGLKFVSRATDWIKNDVVKGYAAPLHVRGSTLAQVWQARSPKDGAKPVPHNLGHITQPALLLWGGGDKIFPASDGEKLTHTLPNAMLHVFDGAGHVVHEEKPHETAEAIVAFLGQTGR
jgi:pimeloyl-ACP methyl ester carboxylesterase